MVLPHGRELSLDAPKGNVAEASSHCCPVVGTCVMDNAFNHRDLRVEEDVSDLEFDLQFWRRATLPNNVLACSPTDAEDPSKLGLGVAACVYALVAILNEGFLRRGSLHSV